MPLLQGLIVFAKLPEPGRVKTRLTPPLSPEEAARLYEAFLRDALTQYGRLDAEIRLYISPSSTGSHSELPVDVDEVFEQKGDGLGSRMARAFVETFAAGYERVVIIGTDHPTLPTSFIELAFASLDEPRSLCIGPSDDGGFYLLGMNDFFPDLFRDMEYSHERVFEQTLDRAGRRGLNVTVLPTWYDVDTPASLRRLADDLAREGAQAPHTKHVLDGLLARRPGLVG